jgi:K+-transporting ATPase c subunit
VLVEELEAFARRLPNFSFQCCVADEYGVSAARVGEHLKHRQEWCQAGPASQEQQRPADLPQVEAGGLRPAIAELQLPVLRRRRDGLVRPQGLRHSLHW